MSERGKSPGDDNIPAELIKNGGGAMISTLTIICNSASVEDTPKVGTGNLRAMVGQATGKEDSGSVEYTHRRTGLGPSGPRMVKLLGRRIPRPWTTK